MTKKFLTKSFLSLTALTLLTGCGPNPLGLNAKKSPDEFLVTTRAPLEVPSEFKLVQPQPGVQRPQEKTTQEMAVEGVFGGPTQAAATQNTEDQNFVGQFATSGVDPQIRQKVNQEAEEDKNKISPVAKSLMFWKDPKLAGTKTIDPVAESEKLKGKSVDSAKEIPQTTSNP